MDFYNSKNNSENKKQGLFFDIVFDDIDAGSSDNEKISVRTEIETTNEKTASSIIYEDDLKTRLYNLNATTSVSTFGLLQKLNKNKSGLNFANVDMNLFTHTNDIVYYNISANTWSEAKPSSGSSNILVVPKYSVVYQELKKIESPLPNFSEWLYKGLLWKELVEVDQEASVESITSKILREENKKLFYLIYKQLLQC